MTQLLPLDLLNAGGPPHQDFIILDGVRSPGVCTITNAGSPRTWDKQKGWGFSGATLIYTGDDLSDFDVLVAMWLPEHWAQWNAFARVLEKSPVGARAKALFISHPLLYRAPLRITSVVIRDVTQLDQSKTGLWTARIPMTAFRAPKPALGRPDGSIDKAKNPISDFSDDPEIAALMTKQKALGGVL